MEWLLDPAAWVGLFTLIVLEVVLGIDNLVFIAILVEKLPPSLRDRARVLGLSLALVMRLALLSVMSWLIKLTAPLINLASISFSGRDLIFITGGFFLLFKGTFELHERLEGRLQQGSGERLHASFGLIVTQIVVLDAVFSLDSVITAVGMVDHLLVMALAVIVAMGIMLFASKPLTRFINQHPTVVVLCLCFLLMIGFSLVVEGFGLPVPKGYLYAAIGFSVLIELLNQIARINQHRVEARRPMRERTAEGIMRMLGKRPSFETVAEIDSNPAHARDELPEKVFDETERNMVSGVLTLADRNIHSIMTPRNDISWLNLEEDPQVLRQKINQTPHSFFPVCRGSLDEVVGIGRAKDLVADLLSEGSVRLARLRDPIIVHDSIGILHVIDILKRAKGQLVLVADEFGAIEGVVTPIDVFEAIAGEFPDEDETPDIVALDTHHWHVDGAADLHHLEQVLNTEGLVPEDEEYATLAGWLLARFGHLPAVGDACELAQPHANFSFTVRQVDGLRIAQVAIERRLAGERETDEDDEHVNQEGL